MKVLTRLSLITVVLAISACGQSGALLLPDDAAAAKAAKANRKTSLLPGSHRQTETPPAAEATPATTATPPESAPTPAP